MGSSSRDNVRGICSIRPSCGGDPELVLEHEDGMWERQVAAGGGWITLSRGSSTLPNRVDVVAAPLDAPDSSLVPIATTEFNERSLDVSPDGAWIAYVSNESGADEVYVQAFPQPTGRTRVSADGGNSPMWSTDASTLYYRTTDGMMAARFDPDAGHIVGREVLFDQSSYDRSIYYATYDVDPHDGDLLLVATGGMENREIHMIVNWSEELRRLTAN